MDFFDVVRNRRSIRNFKTDPLPEGALEKILGAARFTMSGGNGQPWEFIVVTKQETKEKLGEMYVQQARKRACILEATREPEYRHNMFKKFYPNPPGWQNAPALVVVCGDLRTFMATVTTGYFYRGDGAMNGTYLMNVGNASHMICLAAAALGLGTEWVSVESMWESMAKRLLKVPDELTIHNLVAIGYSAYQPAAPYRRELDEIVHHEEYDHSKYRTEEKILEFLRLLRAKTKPAYDDYFLK